MIETYFYIKRLKIFNFQFQIYLFPRKYCCNLEEKKKEYIRKKYNK